MIQGDVLDFGDSNPGGFLGRDLQGAVAVCRDLPIDRDARFRDDLLETIEETVRRRRFGSVVRMTINRSMPDHVRDLLVHELGVQPNDVYPVDGPLTLRSLMSLASIERHDLREPSFIPAMPPVLDTGKAPESIFEKIRQQDILLHHPFDSFAPVVDFLETAAHDPDVLAIKVTLYRVGRDSPVVVLRAHSSGASVDPAAVRTTRTPGRQW